MNKMDKVAELLGVELGEWFEIREVETNHIVPLEFKITLDGCINSKGDNRNNRLIEIIKGKYKIVEKPWTPKQCENYYYPTPVTSELTSFSSWDEDEHDLRIQRNVGVYRTKEEAIAKAKELGWT